MGKKGKNKNQTINIETVPKVESENAEKETKKEIPPEVPVVAKPEEVKVEPEKVENSGDEDDSKEGTLKSKKRRNRKKKNTATEIKIEESAQEKNEPLVQKEELKTTNQAKPEPAVENQPNESSTDTLKKKRRRNKNKKNADNSTNEQDENVKEESPEKDKPKEVVAERSGEDTATSQQNTLKKRKRNRNKNKTPENADQNEEKSEKPVEPLSSEAQERLEPQQKRGKKQKRHDLSSKKSISDELKERQEREQKEAREHIKNEIVKREKLLETIDLVLDCHKSEAELAKSQQESIKDVKKLSTEAAKVQSKPSTSKVKPPKKPLPAEEELVNKIEQVLGMTKLEIQNAQTQKAYVGRLETELAKVKQSKDILLGKEPSSAVPPHISKMATEICDLTKEVPKSKDELVKEIESRDALMSEINRVLDTTKTEIEKVQKQQKIIQNLEVELSKMKEQEIADKLMALAEEAELEEHEEPPPPPKQSAGTASLLDALMANVGKLKEIQALKEQQKAEKAPVEEPKIQETQQKPVEPIVDQKVEVKTESKVEVKAQDTQKPVEQKQEEEKSPPKDAKKVEEEKKQPSPKGSPEQHKKHQKDQKKQPQKNKQESKPVLVEKKEEATPKAETNKKDRVVKESSPVKQEVKADVKSEKKNDKINNQNASADKKIEKPKVEEKLVEAPKPIEKPVQTQDKKPEVKKAEEKKPEVKKVEEKKSEVKKTEEKQPEPHKPAANIVEAPKPIEKPVQAQEKKPDVKKVEEKKPEPSKTFEQKVEVPKPAEQKVESSKLADKNPESPKKDHKKDSQKKKRNDSSKSEKVEPPTHEEKKLESPKLEEKKIEEPKVEKQAVELPKPEPKKVDSPKQEAVKPEPKKIETPKPEKKEVPKSEEKKLDSPVENKIEPKPAEPIEVKPITSSEPIAEKSVDQPKDDPKSSPKVNDHKKNDKGNKHKNKHHKHDKKDTPKGVPEVVELPPVSAWSKPSMAEMLKNAPDPPPDEVDKKPDEEVLNETAAPLARPESAIIEVKPSEQIKEVAQPEVIKDEKKIEEISTDIKPVVESPKAIKEESPIVESPSVEVKSDDGLVIVDKEEVEKEMKQDEKDQTDPKNVQGSGFVSPANNIKDQDKDAKPLRKDAKNHANKARSPVKAPSKAPPQKPTGTKPPQTKPKIDVQAKVNSKPTDAKKTPTSPTKPSSPLTEKSQPKFENAETAAAQQPSSPKIIENNSAPQVDNPPLSTEKPKIPPRPDVTKTSNTKPAPKAGNVTNQSTSPAKPKTPSPSKPPSVTKPSTNAQSLPQTAKPKPTVSQTKQSATPKPPSNTKTTNQKPLATQQKTNSTKPSTPKSSSATCDSVFRLRQVTPSNNHNKTFSQPAFRIRMDEKSMNPIKRPLTSSNPDNNSTNQMKAILTNDGTIKIILPSTVTTGNLREKFLSKDHVTKPANVECMAASSKMVENSNDKPEVKRKNTLTNEDNESDDDDEYSEYKMTPRQIFCASICQVCKVNLSRYFLCNECKMVAYCKEEHMKIDYLNHKGLCMAIQLIAKRRGGHVYNMAKHLSSMEFRNLRLHTIYLCEQFMNRTLLTFEKEIFLFPRLCHEDNCREWKLNLLKDCEKCGLVSFCALHPLHENHKRTCSSFALFQRIILHEKSYGRVNIALPQKVLKKIPFLTDNVQDTMRLLYRNITAFQDECVNAALMQIASAPLTTFYSYQKVGMEFKEQITIHFVGAELKFEGDRLEKWESLFLHLAHGVSDLQIIFIGSELNCENLPVEIISRTRMCKLCRQDCCGIRFDFQCKKFYHDYCESPAFIKPDYVCFFNPALYRPGFRGFDTWPKTIYSALKTGAPVLVTSTTENECYLDLKRIKKVTSDDIEILVPPLKNPYCSTRPERNFASDDEDPLMFKNNYLFVVGKTPDLIEF